MSSGSTNEKQMARGVLRKGRRAGGMEGAAGRARGRRARGWRAESADLSYRRGGGWSPMAAVAVRVRDATRESTSAREVGLGPRLHRPAVLRQAVVATESQRLLPQTCSGQPAPSSRRTQPRGPRHSHRDTWKSRSGRCQDVLRPRSGHTCRRG